MRKKQLNKLKEQIDEGWDERRRRVAYRRAMNNGKAKEWKDRERIGQELDKERRSHYIKSSNSIKKTP